MTTVHATIDPAGRSLSDRASLSGQASSPGQGSAGHIGRPAMAKGDPLTAQQAEALCALRSAGTQAMAARKMGVSAGSFHNHVKALRAKGYLQPTEYRAAPKQARAPHERVPSQMPMGMAPHRIGISSIMRKVAAARDARQHVIEEVHYSRKGHVLSSVRCTCGAKMRTCNRDRTRGHAELAELFAGHARLSLRKDTAA